jgi:hypothetical protein
LSDLVDALILRDASDLYAIRRIDSFRRLLGLVAGQTGDLVKMSEPAAKPNNPRPLTVVNPSLQADTLIERTPGRFLPPLSFARRLQDLFDA